MNARFEGIEKRLHFLEENRRDLSRMVSAQVFHQKEEEYQKLKKEKEVLEQRLHHILAKAMESHKFSENLNDPCRLSAVLEMYDRLRTHEWEKAKCAARLSGFSMTYKDGGTIIKAVFTKCEGMLSQRMDQIRKLLECPVLKETTTQQLSLELAQDIKNHLKNLYFKLGEDFYQSLSLVGDHCSTHCEPRQPSWVRGAATLKPPLPTDLQMFQPLVNFTAKCFKIYCLLLLQNPPVKAEWPERISAACIEHVDNKEMDCSMPINFLWPVLTCGEQVIRKGVSYD